MAYKKFDLDPFSVYSDGECIAGKFTGDYESGVGTAQISVSTDTGILNTGSDTTSHFGGYIIMDALPTSDPTTLGQLWNSNGTVKVSAG